MTHVDALEARNLFAVAEIRDTTFGDDGVVKLPSYVSVQGMTATHGSIYVDAYNYKKGRRLVYKYTDAGTLDTTWGNGGYVVPRVIENSKARPLDTFTALNLAYDARTGGLLMGFANGDAIAIERRTADGAPDESWGTHGLYAFRNTGIDLTLNAVTPLASRKLLIALSGSHTASKTTAGQTRSATETDVALIRLDRHARYDKTFSGNGRATVASGTTLSTRTPATDSTGVIQESLSAPTFGDLQLTADGGYRVITTREQTAATYQYDSGPDSDEYNTKSGRSTYSAESARVSAAGTVTAPNSFLLKRAAYTDTSSVYDAYLPKLAIAEGDAGAIVLANLGFSGHSVLHVRPGFRSGNTSLTSADPYVFEIFRNAAGITFVETSGGSSFPTVAKYDASLNLDMHFGTKGIYTESDGYIGHAADDNGRLVVALSGKDELYRLL